MLEVERFFILNALAIMSRPPFGAERLRYRIEDIERNREYVRVKQAHAVGPFHISCPK